MKKILTVGSIGVDYVFLVDQLPNKGQSLISKGFQIFCGGKGANQAVALGKMGADVKMIGRVGTDEAGEISIKNLKDNNIDTTYVKKTTEAATQIANIIVDKNGDNMLIVDVGANFTFKHSDIEEYKALIDEADIILLQLEITLEFAEEFIKYARSKNKTIILNPAPAKVMKPEILKMCDFLTPNETELCILLEKPYTDDLGLLEKYAMELWNISKRQVIVTLGQNGSFWINEAGDLKKTESKKVKAVDATAAGDTFMAGFVCYYAQGKTIEEAIEFATIASALCVTKLGAQSSLPSMAEIEKFKSEIN